jgi:multiple sugar transport system permease protein
MELSLHQKKRIRQGIIFMALLIFTIVWLLPVFGAVLTSIRTMDDIMDNGFWSLPEAVTFKNFATAWSEGNLNTYLTQLSALGFSNKTLINIGRSSKK